MCRFVNTIVFFCSCFFLLINVIHAQKSSLLSGPIAGHYTDSTALFWFMWAKNKPVDRELLVSKITEKHGRWLGNIQDFQIYDSIQTQSGTMLYGRVTRQAPARTSNDMTFIAGSCAFQFPFPFLGKRVRRNTIFTTMAKEEKPEFMIWLGDNVYLVAGQWNSADKMIAKHLRVRTRKKMRPFMERFPNYANWDDHDYGPNNSDGSFPTKNLSLEIFRQTWLNPSYGGGKDDGMYTMFSKGDADFFFLDARFYSDKTQEKMFGDKQMQWLKNQLLASKGSFKFIVSGTQMLSTDLWGETFHTCPKEQQDLFDFIDQHQLQGVIFLSGDRHFAELHRLQLPKGTLLYDITTSPMTSFLNYMAPKNLPTRVPNTLIIKPNYARISLVGEGDARRCFVELLDKKGQLFWKYDIYLKEFKK